MAGNSKKGKFQIALEKVEAQLNAAPPDTRNYRLRKKALLALDKLIASPQVATDPDLIAFYQRRVDQGLDALELPPPRSGARIVKFYSASVVIQMRNATFAFDVAEGPSTRPVPAEQDPKKEYTHFRLTNAQRDRLADAIDAYFITHFHEDHLSYALAGRMIARGKPVIVPGQGKPLWKAAGAPFADRLTTLTPDATHRLGPISVRFYPGTQYMSYHGQDAIAPVFQSPAHRETNCYLVKVADMIFCNFGENQDPNATIWARRCSEEGWTPDVFFALGMGYARAQLLTVWHGLTVAVHEYEFTHNPPNRYAGWLGANAEKIIKSRSPFVPVFWGEYLEVPAPVR